MFDLGIISVRMFASDSTLVELLMYEPGNYGYSEHAITLIGDIWVFWGARE